MVGRAGGDWREEGRRERERGRGRRRGQKGGGEEEGEGEEQEERGGKGGREGDWEEGQGQEGEEEAGEGGGGGAGSCESLLSPPLTPTPPPAQTDRREGRGASRSRALSSQHGTVKS